MFANIALDYAATTVCNLSYDTVQNINSVFKSIVYHSKPETGERLGNKLKTEPDSARKKWKWTVCGASGRLVEYLV